MPKQPTTIAKKLPPPKKSYHFAADIIRVLAISGVVMIHTANAVFARPDFFGGISWWIAIVLNSLSRIAIPLFIMLSGYFLLSKDESWHKSLKRTLNRILIPLLFWFIIYISWSGGNPSFAHLNISLLARFVTVNVFDLYFLIILLGLYIAAPILRAFLHKESYVTQRNITFFLLGMGVVMFLMQYLFSLCSPADAFTYWLPYTGLFVAGYFWGNNNNKITNTKLLITYSVALLTTIGLSYLYFSLHNNGNNLLASHDCLTYYSDSYLGLNVVVMAVPAFILLMRCKFQFLATHLFIKRLIYSVARASLGIYLLHTFFLNILDSRYHVFDHIAPAWMYIIIKWTVIFTLSYVSTLGLMRIPGVKRVFGETK